VLVTVMANVAVEPLTTVWSASFTMVMEAADPWASTSFNMVAASTNVLSTIPGKIQARPRSFL
jgi:hypothetical protein